MQLKKIKLANKVYSARHTLQQELKSIGLYAEYRKILLVIIFPRPLLKRGVIIIICLSIPV